MTHVQTEKYIPAIGEICEYRLGVIGLWYKCEIIAHNRLVIRCPHLESDEYDGIQIVDWDLIEFRKLQRTIRIGDYEVPEPVYEVKDGTAVWLIGPSGPSRHTALNFCEWFQQVLKAGLVHLDRESAELHYKAITSFTRVK